MAWLTESPARSLRSKRARARSSIDVIRHHATTTIQQVVAQSGAEAATGASSIDPPARADFRATVAAGGTSTTAGHIGAPVGSVPGFNFGSGTGEATIKVRARPYIRSTLHCHYIPPAPCPVVLKYRYYC